jgi:hypothetical protein
MGHLRRTIHAAKYLSDPAYRRRIGRQLNKGESLHALRRGLHLHYAQQGVVAVPHLADQTEQTWCLTVLTNAVITWTTEYYQLAVKDRAQEAGTCLMSCWPTSPRPIRRTSTSSVSSPSTSMPSSPNSTPTAGVPYDQPHRTRAGLGCPGWLGGQRDVGVWCRS